MGAETVTYADARTIAINYYVGRRSRMPLPLREAPFKKVENVVLSINAVIAAMESNTDIGQWLVYEYADSMGMLISA